MALMERALEGLGIGVGIDGSPAPEIDFCARAGLDRSMVAAFLSGQIDSSLLPEPAWGPIGKVVFERTYARDVPGEDRKETWAETVRRVVLGNLSYAPEHLALPAEAEQLFALLYSFSAIPAGRHLWVTGVPGISSMSRNCWVSAFSRRTSSHFRFLAARLFEGGGVGANYTNDLLAVTSPILGSVEVRFVCDRSHPDAAQVEAAAGDSLLAAAPAGTTQVVTVDDTREGWVDAWCAIIDLACQPGEHRLVLSVSGLRPHGAPLRTFGGRASGPAPFVTASTSIARVLAEVQGRRLSGLEAMTIDHHIASAVVAGGSRRSARLALMRWDDPDIFAFVDCKADQLSHWSANISVEIDAAFRRAVADGDPQATAVLRKVAEGMARNGEPGLIDTGLASETEPVPLRAVNPCGESFLAADDGTFGVADGAGEACNLGSVDLARFGTDIAAAAAAVGLVARFLYRSTTNPHPDPTAGRIEAVNRRIGVGIMGLQGWVAAHGWRLSDLPNCPDLLGELTYLRVAARFAADELADALGTPRSVKVTAVAPTGTIAQLGGTTPGLHPCFARRFIRRVRFADSDPAWREEAAKGFRVLDDIYASNTKVVEYPTTDTILDRWPERLIEQADEIGPAAFLDLIAAVQASYVGGFDGQAVSATAHVDSAENPDRIVEIIAARLGKLKGFTLFPALSRDLPPYEAIDVETYERLRAALDVTASTVGDSNDGECEGSSCPIR